MIRMPGLLISPSKTAEAEQQEGKAQAVRMQAGGIPEPKQHQIQTLKGAEGPQALIPGLPDDLGFQCLLRSSRFSIPRYRLVSRVWNEALCDPDLFSWRDSLGLGEEWLYMCIASKRSDQEHRFDWFCFVPSRRSWLMLPPVPEDNDHGYVRTTGFGVTAVDGLGLFIAGGSIDGRGLVHVTVFDFRTGQWGVIQSPQFSARVDPVVASMGAEVYIAGGKDCSQSEVVQTMLAIDAATHSVTSMPSCGATGDAPQGSPPLALVWCETLKFGQQLYARSRRDCLFGAPADSGPVFAFNPKSKEWSQYPTGANVVSKAWKALMAPLGGTLYMVDGSLCLWRWDERARGGSWARVGGTLRYGYVLKKLVACAGRLYAFVFSADCGKHSMLEVQLSHAPDTPLNMTLIDLPGNGYYSAVACSRL